MNKKNGRPSPKREKDFSRKIYKILAKDPNKSFNYKQIAAILEADDTNTRNEIIKELKMGVLIRNQFSFELDSDFRIFIDHFVD